MLPALMLRTTLPMHLTMLRSDVASFEGLGFAPRPSFLYRNGASTKVLRQYRASHETILTLFASTTVHPGNWGRGAVHAGACREALAHCVALIVCGSCPPRRAFPQIYLALCLTKGCPKATCCRRIT